MTSTTVITRRPSFRAATTLRTEFSLPTRRASYIEIVAERTALWFFDHKQVKQWFARDPFGAVVWGYLCFIAVLSFLLLPMISLILAFLVFGLSNGAILLITISIYHKLEDKLHPAGRTGRHWPAFHDRIGNLWKAFARILPITVLKLSPDETYAAPRKFLFGYHPHGVLFYGAGVVAMNWSEFFPGTKCSNLMSSMCFALPGFRSFCQWIGGVPATVACARSAVEDHGSSLSVIPGGVREMLYADPSSREITLILKQRKGFIRLALQLGLDLVPVFTHGEVELYHQATSGLAWRLRLSRFLRAPVTMIWGQFAFLPFRNPLIVVVGHPINVEQVEAPTAEQVDELHEKYMNALLAMFEETKEEAGYGDTKLVIR